MEYLIVDNAHCKLWHTISSLLKECFFSWYVYRMAKEFLKFVYVEIEKLSSF